MNKKFQFNTLVMIGAVVVFVAALTWLMPGGQYQRVEKDGKNLVVSDSYSPGDSRPQGVGALLLSPVKGFMQASEIIVFLLIIGGAFRVLEKTGAINASIQRLARFFSENPAFKAWFIPVMVTIFSVGGATFGMCEETMAFIPIFIPLAIALGYDSLIGTAIPFLGAAAGVAGSVFNPFTVGIAQNIAELPMYSGKGYRMIIWLISTASMIVFLLWYARKIKKDPSASLVCELDAERKHAFHLDQSGIVPFTPHRKMVMAGFAFGMATLVFGVLRYSWYISELAALFLATGIVCGLLGRLDAGEIADSFKEGAKDMVGVALIIACARATLVLATDGRIMDSILHALASGISGLHPVLGAQAMFITQGIINFFVHSGSGQAALTMPVMAPLADVIGITRQTAVLAFQFGEGWINPILPTSGVTMGVLGIAGISWGKWVKWMLPVQIYFFLLALALLIPPVLLQWQ